VKPFIAAVFVIALGALVSGCAGTGSAGSRQQRVGHERRQRRHGVRHHRRRRERHDEQVVALSAGPLVQAACSGRLFRPSRSGHPGRSISQIAVQRRAQLP
jgi:hypothetical protein